MRRYPFRIDAFVVLPDHLHAIWTLPEGDADFSTRWRLIKTRFARTMPKTEWLDPTRAKKGERGIWQRRAGRIDRAATQLRLAQLELVTKPLSDRLERPRALGHDLGADPIAGDEGDGCLHVLNLSIAKT